MGSQRLRRRWGNTTTPTSRAQAPTACLIAARIALLNTSSALRGSGGTQSQTVTSLASNATAPPISLSVGTLILLASRRGSPWGVPVVPSANTGQDSELSELNLFHVFRRPVHRSGWAASSALRPLPPCHHVRLKCPNCGSREVIWIFHVAREPDYIAARRA